MTKYHLAVAFYVCIDVFKHSKELSLAVAALSVFDLLFC